MNPLSHAVYAVAGLCLLASQAGCAQLMNQDLSPPPGGETVSVSVKVPKDLAADTMRVMYRSEKCPITRSDGNGGRYEIDGAKAIEVEPQRQGMTDIYEAKLARDGGGFCEWKLSNVTFGVHYQNTNKFGEDVKAGGGGGVIVIFDDNQPQQRSLLALPVEVRGDFFLNNEYYPWLDRQFRNGYKSEIWLAGKGESYSAYKVVSANKVEFEPRVYSNVIVESVWPQEHRLGSFIKFYYPDGAVIADGSSKPSFERLEKIRLGR